MPCEYCKPLDFIEGCPHPNVRGSRKPTRFPHYRYYFIPFMSATAISLSCRQPFSSSLALVTPPQLRCRHKHLLHIAPPARPHSPPSPHRCRFTATHNFPRPIDCSLAYLPQSPRYRPQVIFACPADTALALLGGGGEKGEASSEERDALSRFAFSDNTIYVHRYAGGTAVWRDDGRGGRVSRARKHYPRMRFFFFFSPRLLVLMALFLVVGENPE